MNCPKCGYEQEEGLDCKKCGIVFSKYTALHHPDKLLNPEDIGPPQAKELPEEGSDFGLIELRQTLRDVGRRFSEIEFERAQRHQLRAEMKNLEQRFQEELAGLASRIAETQKQGDDREALRIQDALPRAELDRLLQRLEAMESFPEIFTRGLDALKEELAGLKSGQSGDDSWASDAMAAMDLKFQEQLVPLSQLAQEVVRADTLSRSLEADIRKLQEASEAAPRQQTELKSDLLELTAKVRQLELKLDSMWGEFNGRLCETREEEKFAIGQNVQSILESLDNLRCSVASLSPKP